jgi:hypothetical protein
VARFFSLRAAPGPPFRGGFFSAGGSPCVGEYLTRSRRAQCGQGHGGQSPSSSGSGSPRALDTSLTNPFPRLLRLAGVEVSTPLILLAGTRPVGCASLAKGISAPPNSEQAYLSAECPRNTFPRRSCTSNLVSAEQSPTFPSRVPNSSVRQPDAGPPADGPPCDPQLSLAHTSIGLTIHLNASWRVVDDGRQWFLQRKRGNPRSKNLGWCNRSFCTTRPGLLRCVREYCGDLAAGALAKLEALPLQHVWGQQ